MKRLLAILALLLLPSLAHASFVQGNHVDYATASSTACATGTVTSGNVEIMIAGVNSTTRVTISSTRVTTWKQAQVVINANSTYIWYGTITSSGAETVTVSLTTGTAVLASICLEYSGTVNVDASNSTTGTSLSLVTVAAATTIVEVATSGSGSSISASSPFTSRQQASSGGTAFFAAGDVNESSQGTYSAAFTGGTIVTIEMISLTSATPPAHSYVQFAAGNGLSAATQTCTFPANVTSGDLLVVGTKNNGANISSIADTLSTSWTTDFAGAGGSNPGYFHGTASSSGADTITVTWSSTVFGIIACGEWGAIPNLDVKNSNSSSVTIAVTTTKASTTLIWVTNDGATGAISAPFTPRMTAAMQTGPVGTIILADVMEAATGTYTATTSSAAANNALAAFYATAPPNVPRHR